MPALKWDPYPRDAERSRLYRAERAAAWSARAREVLTVAEANAWLQRVGKGKRWQKAYGVARMRSVDCRAARASRRGAQQAPAAWYSLGSIYVAGGATTRWVYAHELAHHLTGNGVPAHGRKFRRVYVSVVRLLLGSTDARALRASFREAKLKMLPKRTLSLARRMQAAAILAEARARRAATT